jgi:hypothetical protein
MNNNDLRILKFQNTLTFHAAAANFHSKANGMTNSLKKQLNKKLGK